MRREEEVYTGGRAKLYTCWDAKPLAEPLTKPCPSTRPGDEHQRRHTYYKVYQDTPK